MRNKLPSVRQVLELALTQPAPIAVDASPEEAKRSDLEHIDVALDISYHALQVAEKTYDFCSVIKAIHNSIELRRTVLNHDTKSKVPAGGKRTLELLS